MEVRDRRRVAALVAAALGAVGLWLAAAPPVARAVVVALASDERLAASLDRATVGWLTGELRLEGLTLTRRADDEVVLAAPEARADVSLRDLLQGRLRLAVVVRGATIALAPGAAPDAATLGARLARAPPLVIERLVLEDATVRVRPGPRGDGVVLRDVQVDASRLPSRRVRETEQPTEVTLTARVGEDGEIRARLRGDLLASEPRFDLKLHGVRVPLALAAAPAGETGTVDLAARARGGRFSGEAVAEVDADHGPGDKEGPERHVKLDGRFATSGAAVAAAVEAILADAGAKLVAHPRRRG
jgi:hypothetical protein